MQYNMRMKDDDHIVDYPGLITSLSAIGPYDVVHVVCVVYTYKICAEESKIFFFG